jgi:hypothetical protein
MSFLKKLSDLFNSQDDNDSSGYWIHVRCGKCGEFLKTRIDLEHDLTTLYGESGEIALFTRKTMVGSSGCFQRIEIELGFNQHRRLVNREISGGSFIDPDEFLAENKPSN